MKRAVLFLLLDLLILTAVTAAQEYQNYPKGAVLHVSSFPSGASVTVDGVLMKDRDDDSIAVTPVHFDLSLGKHVVVVGLADPGWAPYKNTVNITKRDNDLSVTLLPVMTQGLQGTTGPIGPPGADGAQGPQGIPGLSIVGPPGTPGAQGISGPTGASGRSSFQGTWSSSGSYQAGDMVFGPTQAGLGPFFNLTGSSTIDPAQDTTNWLCLKICDPPAPTPPPQTETPFSVSGSYTGPSAGPPANLPFNLIPNGSNDATVFQDTNSIGHYNIYFFTGPSTTLTGFTVTVPGNTAGSFAGMAQTNFQVVDPNGNAIASCVVPQTPAGTPTGCSAKVNVPMPTNFQFKASVPLVGNFAFLNGIAWTITGQQP